MKNYSNYCDFVAKSIICILSLEIKEEQVLELSKVLQMHVKPENLRDIFDSEFRIYPEKFDTLMSLFLALREKNLSPTFLVKRIEENPDNLGLTL